MTHTARGRAAAAVVLSLLCLGRAGAYAQATSPDRVTLNFPGAVMLASSILVVTERPGAKGAASIQVKIEKVIHLRTNWTPTQIKSFAGKRVPATEIQVGAVISLSCYLPAEVKAQKRWIALVDSPLPSDGLFWCNDDWPAVPESQEKDILKILSSAKRTGNRR